MALDLLTCEGCHHEASGRCRLMPQQVIAPGSFDVDGWAAESWGFPPANARCSQFRSDETVARRMADEQARMVQVAAVIFGNLPDAPDVREVDD